MKKIVIFASGSGSNTEKIITHFENNNTISIIKIVTNKPNAKVLNVASKHSIATQIINKEELDKENLLKQLINIDPDLIVLAGFLLKFPESIISHFPNKIINIHPSLLPKYGGKGMYGLHVHQTVLDNKEVESGITIHYVNNNYDEGKFIFQKSVNIEHCKTPEEIADKIHTLEHQYFPEIIERLLTNY
ncbi:MAG: phosphoribosylglycinamide formyltransferase [Flavobacterium sp.]|nr:phosphoribosylglycinamide formyltransferase [Flavobacterium sp.]